MSHERLTRPEVERLFELYQHAGTGGHRRWAQEYERDLAYITALDPRQLGTPAVQERLWSLKGLGTAGPSESIDVSAVIGQPEISAALVRIAEQGFDPHPTRRANELQRAHDHLLALIEGRLQRRPLARLLRLLHALRPGDFACLWSQESRYAVRDLLLGTRGQGAIVEHVMMRARLREVLGSEPNVSEHARRSIFCWWLFENAAIIQARDFERLAQAPDATLPEPVPPEPSEPAPLELLSPARQVRWLGTTPGGLTALRLVLRECLEPQGLDMVHTALTADPARRALREAQARGVVRALVRLGLLESTERGFRTTDAGEAVLDIGGEELIAGALAVRVQGFAALISALDTERSVEELREALRPHAPLDADALLAHHLWWAQVAGLIVRRGPLRVAPAPAADALRPRVAGQLPAAAAPEAEPAPFPAPTPAQVASLEPDLPALRRAIDEATGGQFVLSPATLRDLHAALSHGPGELHRTRRFVLLAGLSGTGKTALLRHYAQATCDLLGLDSAQHSLVVPVRPDWRDPSGLLGFLNALHAEPRFHAEPALRLVLRAAADPERPYFLLLDEMNLARVEQYFAPFLSSMETGEPLTLHAHPAPVDGVPPSVPWPRNLRIAGTVNMDETTHAFSDKVLDRAFTLEFWDVDLAAFFARRGGRVEADEPVERLLLALHAPLRVAGHPFGYRTAGEVLRWVRRAREIEPAAPLAELLDQATLSFVLPRLRGIEGAEMSEGLAGLAQVCGAAGLVRSQAKVAAMEARLRAAGVVGFWG